MEMSVPSVLGTIGHATAALIIWLTATACFLVSWFVHGSIIVFFAHTRHTGECAIAIRHCAAVGSDCNVFATANSSGSDWNVQFVFEWFGKFYWRRRTCITSYSWWWQVMTILCRLVLFQLTRFPIRVASHRFAIPGQIDWFVVRLIRTPFNHERWQNHIAFRWFGQRFAIQGQVFQHRRHLFRGFACNEFLAFLPPVWYNIIRDNQGTVNYLPYLA